MASSFINDDCIQLILSFVGYERNHFLDNQTYYHFNKIENVSIRQRMKEYCKKQYLLLFFKTNGTPDPDIDYHWLFHHYVYVGNSRYYLSAGTAETVGLFGHLGLFMYYIGTIMGEEENKDHPYAQAALRGVVAEGHLGLLEGLASLAPPNLTFY